MATDNVTPIRTGGSCLPPQEILERRLEAAQGRLFNAMGAVSVAAAAAPGEVKIGEPDFRRALRAIEELLDSIATQIDPVTVLDQKLTSDEEIARATEASAREELAVDQRAEADDAWTGDTFAARRIQ